MWLAATSLDIGTAAMIAKMVCDQDGNLQCKSMGCCWLVAEYRGGVHKMTPKAGVD